MRHISGLGRKLNDHKHILMMLFANDVAGLRHLIGATHRRGASPAKICSFLQCAVAGLYHPQGGFVKCDFDIAFLVKAIGGPRLLYALGKSHGLASWRTVNHHIKIPKLVPSIGIPLASEIIHNILSFFDPSVKPPLDCPSSGYLPGNVMMFDGIALETRCRYCPERDKILGLCHEHSKNINNQVDSVESVDKIHSALASDNPSTKVCFGSDATVVAIAQYSDDKYYSPVPVVASPSDKTEKADDLAKWMQTVLDAWKSHEFGEKINGPIWSLNIS